MRLADLVYWGMGILERVVLGEGVGFSMIEMNLRQLQPDMETSEDRKPA